jgi:hypothetical protein
MTITVQHLYPLKSSSAVPNMIQPSAGMDAFRGPLIPTALLRTEGQTTPSRKRAIEMSGAASYYI